MNPVEEILRTEIEAHGPISFARFMEIALYWPELGYYEQTQRPIGRHGDFYTSVSVGSLFGDLLAFQFREWLAAIGPTPPKTTLLDGKLKIIEAGAHDGQLALDILNWFQREAPEWFERFDYWIVESSERRQRSQENTLKAFPRVHCIRGWGSFAPKSVRGVIFANELLDAFPVHRLGWDASRREWFEWCVTSDEREFVWTRRPIDRALAVPEIPDALLDHLPDGFTTEISPAAEAWWHEAATVLGQGTLLTFDYGLSADELILPERSMGTLRAYREHRSSKNILANPSEQDLTAHVNFGAMQAAGEAAGLHTQGLVSQSQFLTRIAERILKPNASWLESRTRAFQTLTHPDHLGHSFKVLIQHR